MTKPYLLTASAFCYPQSGTKDWVGCFSDYDEAHDKGVELLDNKECDSFEVVNLYEWMEEDYD